MPAAHRASVFCAVAALLAGLVYANALHNPFVYDDYHTVVANTSLQRVGDLRAIVLHDVTRPLVNFSYAVDRTLWGAEPTGFHVTSVLLHALNVVLLFQLARRLAPEPDALVAGFAAAAIFAVHPLMTEAVGYISGRSELLGSAFLLTGLLCAWRWMGGGRAGWAIATAAMWVLALASKETAAMFPFALVVCDWLMGAGTREDRRRRTMTLYAPMILTALVAGVGRLVILRAEYPGRVAVHWSYALVELDVLRRYLWLLVNPSHQTLFHEVAPVALVSLRALAALGTAAALGAAAVALRTRAPAASFGLVWFVLMLAPSATLALFDQGEPMAEHRVYIASTGLLLAGGVGIGRLGAWLERARPRLGHVGAVTLGLVLLSLMVETVVRNAVWSSPILLWQESVDLAPQHYRPRLLLGEALEDAGRREEAAEQFRTAIRLRPTDVTGYLKLGLCLVDLGRIDDAKEILHEALDVDPDSEPARRSLTLLAGVETAR